MNATGSTRPGGTGPPPWTSRTAATAVFVALAAALGFLLFSVPNVELITFTVFASGVVLGRWRGALVGALGMAIYSAANPIGSGLGIPTLFAAQVGATAITGLAGGLTARLWGPRGRLAPPIGAVAAGGMGLLLTAIYQASVIVGVAAMSPEFRTGAVAVIVSNAFFSAVHLASNTVLFAVLAPAVLPRAARFAESWSARGGGRPGGTGRGDSAAGERGGER